MISLFAVTSRGLEDVCADEMRKLPGLLIQATGYRRVIAMLSEKNGETADLLRLRTVDDVFLLLDTWEGIEAQRSALLKLTEFSRKLTVGPSLNIISSLRKLNKSPLFSVTANFVGRRNYSSDEIKEAVAEGIADVFNWQYSSEDLSDLNFRVFIDHETALVGMRLNETPMHARTYKQEHLLGSLKPTVAAAMLEIGAIKPSALVCDPFCGVGTILIEASLMGARSYGGDKNPDAISAAQKNSQYAGVVVGLATWDTQHLPLDRGSVEQIFTNLPWGRQVVVDDHITVFYQKICREFERVLKKDGQILMLTSLPDLLHFEHLEKTAAVEISLYGQTPNILRYV